MKDLSNTQYKSTKPNEYLHVKTYHREEKDKRRQGFALKNMQMYSQKKKRYKILINDLSL